MHVHSIAVRITVTRVDRYQRNKSLSFSSHKIMSCESYGNVGHVRGDECKEGVTDMCV